MKALVVLQPDDGQAEVASGKLFAALHTSPIGRWFLRRRVGARVGQGTWVTYDDPKVLTTAVELMWISSEKQWAQHTTRPPLRLAEPTEGP